MSYSMSPPAQKPAPRPYSPYGQNAAASPPNSNSASPSMADSPYGPPPAKRQRMSPTSPPNGAASAWPPPNTQPGRPNFAPSGYGNPYVPNANGVAHTPYGGPPAYAPNPMHHQSSFNTPQAYPYHLPQGQAPWNSNPQQQSQQQRQTQSNSPAIAKSREMMPPPPRPARPDREEKIGAEELGDSLFGSGINIKDEENYLHNMYHNRHQAPDVSFGSSATGGQQQQSGTSFGSSTLSDGNSNSFQMLTQGTSFSQDSASGAFAGTLGAALSQEEVEVEQRRKRERAARAQAERQQHQLNNQFLQCNNVRKRMDRLARDVHVMLNMTGVYIRQPDYNDGAQSQAKTSVAINGAGSEGVVAVKEEPRPESVLNANTPFEQILSLLSLAAGERIRGLLDEAHTLARARRYGDQGRIVPPEFSDIANGEGRRDGEEMVIPENLTGTPWDEPERVNNGEAPNGQEGEPSSSTSTPKPQAQPQHTISFAGNLNASLQALAARDKASEQARLARRAARKRKIESLNSLSAEDPSAPISTPPADSTDSIAPSTQDGVKMTKKALARQAKEKNSANEAQMHTTTNQTAAFALGRKGKKYDWMTGGSAAMPTNRFAKAGGTSGAGSGAVTPKIEGAAMERSGSGGVEAGLDAGAANGLKKGTAAVEMKWGDWKENSSRGMELRDWLLVLERDGREGKAFVKAVQKLG